MKIKKLSDLNSKLLNENKIIESSRTKDLNLFFILIYFIQLGQLNLLIHNLEFYEYSKGFMRRCQVFLIFVDVSNEYSLIYCLGYDTGYSTFSIDNINVEADHKIITVKAAVKNTVSKYNEKLILKSIYIIHKFSKTLLIKGNNTITIFCANIYIIFY